MLGNFGATTYTTCFSGIPWWISFVTMTSNFMMLAQGFFCTTNSNRQYFHEIPTRLWFVSCFSFVVVLCAPSICDLVQLSIQPLGGRRFVSCLIMTMNSCIVGGTVGSMCMFLMRGCDTSLCGTGYLNFFRSWFQPLGEKLFVCSSTFGFLVEVKIISYKEI